MSAVEIVYVAVSALALVLAVALLLSVRANRRRTQQLQDTITSLAAQVEASRQPAAQPVVHRLEPVEPHPDDRLPAVVAPTTAQVVNATLGRPLVRAVTLGHGLRRALRPESRDRIAALVRREYRRRRRVRMQASRRASRLAVVPPADDPGTQEQAS